MPAPLRGLAAVMLSLALVSAACSDDTAADATPSTTTTTTTTVAPTSTTTDPPAPTTTLDPNRTITVGLSGDIAPAHDPDIAKEGDWYYVFLTGHGVPIRRSQDLAHWEEIGSVFEEPHPAWIDAYDWVNEGDHLGAPDIEFFDDRWHVYYHSHRFATNNAITGHAWNVTLDPDSPDYAWVDDGLVMSSNDVDHTYSVLDANAVVDENGDPWMTFGSFWDGVQITRLDAASGAPVDDESSQLLAGRDPWFLGVEASSTAHHDGHWYLFVSWGFCCQGVDTKYEIRVGRSPTITGPYLDRDGNDMLVNGGSLLLGAHDQVIGPGSGDVLVTDDDSVLVHHWYDRDNDGETTFGVRPLLWSPDGWPVAADTGFVAAGPAATADDVVGVWTLGQYQDSTPATIELRSDGTIADDLGTWSLDAATGTVSLQVDACPALAGSTHLLFFGTDATGAAAGFGHSDTGLPVRAVKTEGAPLTCAAPADLNLNS